jgi:hypothetical protein
MPGYILTGAPGSGKTAILRQLELNGHTVVEEAATDVIALSSTHSASPTHGGVRTSSTTSCLFSSRGSRPPESRHAPPRSLTVRRSVPWR